MFITYLPPPVIALFVAALAWWLAQLAILPLHLPLQQLLIGVSIIAGVVLFAAAGLAMAKARTTINPLTPEKSSRLLSTGVFALSRNPIYLADAVFLFAWALYLEQAFALVAPLLFILLINFQIKKEEQALQALFGDDYSQYCQRVRRWL